MGVIDTSSQLVVNEISPGKMGFAPRFDTAIDQPSTVSTATVYFRTIGRIPIGGSIDMLLPEDDGWGCVGSSTVTFTAPSGSVTGTSACRSGRLIITTGGVDIAQNTLVTFSATNVITPPYDVARKKDGKLRTYDNNGGMIDFSQLFTDRITSPIRVTMAGQVVMGCPNQCSRRGLCINYGVCKCYTRIGSDEPAFTAADCSQQRAKRVKLGQIWHLPTTSPTKKPNAHHKDPAIAKLANANASLAMTGLHASSPVAQITAQARADASRRSTSRLKRSRPTPRHGMPIKSKVAYVMLAAVASTAP